MKRELGIARCGLACCLCSENAWCHGCNSNECPDSGRCENRKCSLERGAADCGCIVRNYGISGTRIARQAQQKSPHALILLRADPFEFLHVCAPLLSPISRN